MKKYKKLLALVLALVMTLSFMPVTSFAEIDETVEENDIREEAAEEYAAAGETSEEDAAAEEAAEEDATAEETSEEDAAAEETAKEDDVCEETLDVWKALETEIYLNPLYEGIVTEDDLIDPAFVPVTLAVSETVSTAEEASEVLRAAMVERENSVSVTFESENSNYSSMMRQLMQDAVAHTGVPNEGDYLAWQYAGYGVGGSYKLNGGTYTYTFTYTITYYTDAEQEAAVTAQLKEVMPQIISDGMTDYEKICAIYHYICYNVKYDYDHLSDSSYRVQFTAYGALVKGTSVCQGYAVLLYRMALEAGLDARVITGTEYSSNEGHAWNIVCLDGVYYNLDATWDSSIYESRKEYYYFLETTSSFNEHVRGSDYTGSFYDSYPEAEEDYGEEYIYHVMQFDHTTATCLEDGVDVYICSVCDESEEHAAAATGNHVWDEGEVTIAPACTADGEITYTCELCGTTETDVIPATGHSIVCDHVEREATCTESGLEVDYCSICGAYELEVIPATGHRMVYDHVEREATCTEDGLEVDYCSVCGEYETEEIPATGHKYNEAVTAEPTCGEDGMMTYTCEVCGDTYTESITATGDHVWDTGTLTKEATCSTEGEIEHICTVCGRSMTEIVEATGEHDWDDGEVVVEPTCSTGLMKYTCRTCGEEMTETIPAVDGYEHNWDEGKVVKAPACTEYGEKLYICQNCGVHMLESIDPTGHKPVTDAAASPTCTEDGLTEGSHCSVCNAVIEAQSIVPALGHDYEITVTQEPTCTETGTMTESCSNCGDTITGEEIPALGHDWDDVTETVPPTCTSEGEMAEHCRRCDAVITEAISALGHDYEITETVAATCTEAGMMTETCSRCGDTVSEEIPALGHNWSEAVVSVEPTCIKSGEEDKICTRCGAIEKEEIPALGHSYESKVTSAATYDEEGEITYTCTVCGDSYTEVIPRLVNEVDVDNHTDVEITIDVEGDPDGYYVMSVEDINGTVSEEEIMMLEEAVDAAFPDMEADYFYIDISIEYYSDSEHYDYIEYTDWAIRITVSIPDELSGADDYAVVRIHEENGETVVTILNTVVNDDGTLTFETDEFSTYAIVALTNAEEIPDDLSENNDTVNPDGAVSSGSDGSDAAIDEEDSEQGEKADASDTGDESRMFLWMFMGLISLAGIVAFSAAGKKFEE